jgi:hypothetical protein
VTEERNGLPGFVAVALYAALGLVLQAVFVLGGAMEVPFGVQEVQPLPGTRTEIFENVVVAAWVAALIFAVLGPFVWWVAVSLVMQLVTSFFGGTGPLSAMFAAVGAKECGEHPDRGRLARTVRTEQPEDLSLVCLKADLFYRFCFSERFTDVLNVDYSHANSQITDYPTDFFLLRGTFIYL